MYKQTQSYESDFEDKQKRKTKQCQQSSYLFVGENGIKEKNQRQLWQILQKQLDMNQDGLEYEQWVNTLKINSNSSTKSVNLKIYKYRQICYKITIIFLLYEILYFKWHFFNPFSISIGFNLEFSDLLSISSIFNPLSATYSIISLLFTLFNPFFLFLDCYSLVKSLVGLLLVTLFKIIRLILMGYLVYRSLQLKQVKLIEGKVTKIERIRDAILQALVLIVFNLLISNAIRYLILPEVIIVLSTYFIFLTQKKNNNLDILVLVVFCHHSNYHQAMVQINFSEYLYPFIQSSLTLLIISHFRFSYSQSISYNVHNYIVLHILYLIFSQQFKILFIFLLVIVLIKLIELIDSKFSKFKQKNIFKDSKFHRNEGNNQIKYKDYRKYWDITLPIDQYH